MKTSILSMFQLTAFIYFINFPIAYSDRNYHGATIKPTQISVQETGKTDSLLNNQLKYSIYGFMSEYSRVYMKLPDQDSVLLELPVRWHPRERAISVTPKAIKLSLNYKHPIHYKLKKISV